MFDKGRLDALRPLVAKTRKGSPARLLLEMIDESIAEAKERSRSGLVDSIRQEGRTLEEAEAIIAAYEVPGRKIEFETVDCWVCDGTGHVYEPACMGAHPERCRKCHGSGRASRVKMPTL